MDTYDMNLLWRPTPEFIHSNERSRTIRDACTPLIYIVRRLLEDEGDLTDEQRAELYEKLAEGRIALRSLGIVHDMHIADDPRDFLPLAESNPVVSAEYAASQFLQVLESQIVPLGAAKDHLMEFASPVPALEPSESRLEAYIKDRSTNTIEDFGWQMAALNLALDFLGIEDAYPNDSERKE